ncbi:MAG TPA: cytochrome c oxidase subunit 3 [Ilumatobacteraceae bacterium]|jgi:heme/copper-type cytochrome/quinol oxidase subunit 3|nr:cytochrome c oxidase subunit 3 [Ilumatobacteraceae bacterium]
MLALPSAAAPAPRRQLFVGTAIGCVAAGSLIGAMLALWMRFRTDAMHSTSGLWMPKGIKVPMVAANTMLLAFVPIFVFAQWAVYAAKRDARSHTALALTLVGVIGVAIVNAQAFIYSRMKLPINEKGASAYNSMFYALTGTFLVLLVIGIGFSAITAFRYLGGRTSDREIVSAHALYWYFLGALFFALWFVVYVTK